MRAGRLFNLLLALVPTLYLPTHYLERRERFVAFDRFTWSFFERLQARRKILNPSSKSYS